MIIHKKTLAVSTAALVMTGGAAYAFINATTVSGGGSVGTKSVVANVELSTEKNLVLDPLNAPTPPVADVFAANPTNVSMLLPAVKVSIDPASLPADCPAASFTATWTPDPTPGSQVVAAKAPAQKVGTVTLTFNDLPLPAVQDTCNGAALALVFSKA